MWLGAGRRSIVFSSLDEWSRSELAIDKQQFQRKKFPFFSEIDTNFLVFCLGLNKIQNIWTRLINFVVKAKKRTTWTAYELRSLNLTNFVSVTYSSTRRHDGQPVPHRPSVRQNVVLFITKVIISNRTAAPAGTSPALLLTAASTSIWPEYPVCCWLLPLAESAFAGS